MKLRVGGATATTYVDDVATAAAAFTACLLSVRAARRSQLAFWWLLAAATGAWTAGEAAWAVYELGLGGVPSVSWADVFYLAALPFCAAALLAHPARRGRTIGGLRSLADGGLLALSLFLFAWILVLEPLGRTTDLGSLAGLVTLSYPLGDVVIVFLIVLVIRGTTSREREDVWFLLGGLVLITAADAVYSYLNGVKGFETGGLIDTGWFAGYLAIGLGALSANAKAAVAAPVEHRVELTSLALVAPLLTMLAGLSVLTVRLQTGRPLDGTTETIALALIGLVLVRQALLVVDAARDSSVSGSFGSRLVTALGKAAR